MPSIFQTDVFRTWIRELKDLRAKARINTQIKRLSLGNPGDVKPVGDGISELRIHYGPGYRVYFVKRGMEIVILLCGGDKSTQNKDINQAKLIAADLKDEDD